MKTIKKENMLAVESEDKVVPNVENEYSRLKRVMVIYPPEKITTFNDLVVNPVQKAVIENKLSSSIEEHPEALKQLLNFFEVLKQQGVELVFSKVKSGKNGHTPLFTRDIGLIIKDKVLPASMRYEYRTGEIEGLFQHISEEKIVKPSINYLIEGGDFSILDDGLVLVGIGPRTDIRGFRLLEKTFPENTFISVQPVSDEIAFHLDTLLGVVGKKKIVCIKRLLPKKLLRILKSKGYMLIEADQSEFQTCCTNVIAIDDGKVIAAAENKKTNKNLRNAGIEVIEVKLSEILIQGGGPHCLTLPLLRE